MMRSLGVAVCLFAFGVSTAQAQKLCPGLKDQARTECLRAEQARTQKEIDRINRDNARLDAAIGVAKAGKYAGKVAAGGLGSAAGAVVGGPAGAIVGGEAASSAYGAATDHISNSKPCRGSGNSGTANSTPQRCQ